ncbi:MAG: hypothetical protein WDN03_05695 [Rhizomicrobium sp.]
MEQAYATGARSDAALAGLIGKRHYTLIEFETFDPFPLTRRIRIAVGRAYRIVRRDDDRVFLAPR